MPAPSSAPTRGPRLADLDASRKGCGHGPLGRVVVHLPSSYICSLAQSSVMLPEVVLDRRGGEHAGASRRCGRWPEPLRWISLYKLHPPYVLLHAVSPLSMQLRRVAHCIPHAVRQQTAQSCVEESLSRGTASTPVRVSPSTARKDI